MYVQTAGSAQEGVCPELDYAVKRLVRGLASNRKGARHGFYTALTQVGGSILLVYYFLIGYCLSFFQILSQFSELSVADVLQLVHAHLEPSGGAKGFEERGNCFGKGFALLALISSGVLSKQVRMFPSLPPSLQSSFTLRIYIYTQEDLVGVARDLVALGKMKLFLREFSASTICQLLSVCPMEVCRDHMITALELDAGWTECTAERLQIILHFSQLYGKVHSHLDTCS